MSDDRLRKIQSMPEYAELVKARSRVVWPLAAAMMAVYYAFILVIAFKPDLLAIKLFETVHSTWGIAVGLGVIIFSFILTGIYVRIANKKLEPLTHKLVQSVEGESHE